MPQDLPIYDPCRSDEGGAPKCKRGYDCKSVEMRGRTLHDISISRETNLPPASSSNPKDCDIFIVFEAPDRNDDGLGYVGNSRQMGKLIELVDRAGINKQRVFCAPIVRCQGYNKPSVKEINQCIPHIVNEILMVKPKVVLLLGSTALRLFRLHNKGGLNNIRGTSYHLPIPTIDDTTLYQVIPTFDPSMFFRVTNDQLETKVVGDYSKAANIADGKHTEGACIQSKYTLVHTLDLVDEMVSDLIESGMFAFDTESVSLPWYRAPLLCLSFSIGQDKNYILPINNHDPDGLDYKMKPFWLPENKKQVIEKLKPLFEDINIAKIAHNLKYDCHVIWRWLGIKIQGFFFDTMLMHHVLDEHRPHALEYLADVEFSVGNYSAELHEIVGYGKVLKNTYDNIPDEMLWMYSASDSECTWKLFVEYYQRLLAQPHLWTLYCEEVEPGIHALIPAEQRGHYIDKNKIKVLKEQYEGEKDELIHKIRSETWPDFNPNSPIQVQKAIIDAGFEEEIRDKKAASGYTTSKAKLMELKEECELAEWILKYRTTTKMIGTYLNVIEEGIDNDGRFRPSFLIHGTESGRYSCPVFHQTPRVDDQRTDNIKDVYSTEEGRTLVYFDYSQVELRVLAILANDIEMIKIFYPDNLQTPAPDDAADIHSATAETILGPLVSGPVSKFNRQNCGKNVNFGIAYGSEGHRLVETGQWEDDNGIRHPITWNMLNRGMDRFRAKFYGLAEYLSDVPEIARVQGNKYVTPFGRERRIGAKLCDPDEFIRKAAEREIVNFSIQSPAGAITIRTFIEVHKMIQGHIAKGYLKSDDVFLVTTVHDSVTWDVREDLAEWFSQVVKIIAERPIPELQNTVFPCAIGIGKTATLAEKDAG